MRRVDSISHRPSRRPLGSALLLSGCLAAIPLVVWAFELGEPKFQDKQITKAIASRMQLYHLSNRVMDDEVSRRGLELMLKSLDPTKLYFYQSDIDEFRQSETLLDDYAKAGDLTLAFTIFERLIQRIDERLVTIDQLIDAPHDFTIDEEMETDPDLLSYPADEAEATERWRKRIKYSFLVLKAEKTEGDEAKDKLRRRYSSFAKRMKQFDAEDVTEIFLTSLTTAYDPHSTYFSKTTYENFLIQMRLNLEGIGASLQSEDGVTVIKRIVPGGAADKAGTIKVEDKIVSVGQGETGEMVDVADMKLDDVVGMIRGKAGTVVRLGILSADSSEIKTYSIVREKVELKDSEAQGAVFEAGQKPDGTAYKIGVINLPSFYSDSEGERRGVEDFKSTTRDVRRLLEGFKTDGVDAVVLDLRSNGGGSLPESVDCTGLFIDQGPVVQVKDSSGASNALNDENPGVAWDGPLVVVTSKFSASASEILAGAIQDYERGLIVGDPKTHGKGTVQTLLDLAPTTFGLGASKPQGALKLTIQQFYLPDGRSTQLEGVSSDVVLPSMTAEMDISEGDLEYPLPMDSVKAQPHKHYSMVDSALKAGLQQKSNDRVGQNDDFGKLLARIDAYRKQKAETRVPLREADFMARRKETSMEKEEEKQLDGKAERDKIFLSDFYNEELLNVAIDYVKALQSENKLVTK